MQTPTPTATCPWRRRGACPSRPRRARTAAGRGGGSSGRSAGPPRARGSSATPQVTRKPRFHWGVTRDRPLSEDPGADLLGARHPSRCSPPLLPRVSVAGGLHSRCGEQVRVFWVTDVPPAPGSPGWGSSQHQVAPRLCPPPAGKEDALVPPPPKVHRPCAHRTPRVLGAFGVRGQSRAAGVMNTGSAHPGSADVDGNDLLSYWPALGACEAAPCALQAWGSERRLGLDASKDAANNNPPDASLTSGDETSLGRAQRQRKGAGTPGPDSGFHPPNPDCSTGSEGSLCSHRGFPSCPAPQSLGMPSWPCIACPASCGPRNSRASCPARGRGAFLSPICVLRAPAASVPQASAPAPSPARQGPLEMAPPNPRTQGLSALTSAPQGPWGVPLPQPRGFSPLTLSASPGPGAAPLHPGGGVVSLPAPGDCPVLAPAMAASPAGPVQLLLGLPGAASVPPPRGFFPKAARSLDPGSP